MYLRNLYEFGFLFLTIVISPMSINGAKILGLFTSNSPSHLIVHMSIARTLAEVGHNITIVSTRVPTITHPSIKHIIIPPTDQQEKELHNKLKEILKRGNNVFSILHNFIDSLRPIIDMQFNALQHENFKALYDEHFDLVMLGYFMNEFQLKVAAKFKCPVIVNWVVQTTPIIDEFIGNPTEQSYVPTLNAATKIGEPIGFWERSEYFFKHVVQKLFMILLNYHMEYDYGRLLENEKDLPTLQEMKRNVSLVFCNSHFSEGFIRPNVPAFIEIGGIHIKDKTNPLPKDIADFLDTSSDKGFILFSLGTNLQGSDINLQTTQFIFKTLASLEQKVIWKWEDLENVPGKSLNILYKKWIPQDDILAHPNIKLFITHAGKGGILEAEYHAVPMLALPVFSDQPGNAANMVLKGYGIQLDMSTLTEEEFKNGIYEVLQNPKYKRNIQRFANLYRDRAQSPRESVVFWTEYVLRHHGAKHMQSPLVYLNFFQIHSLDVIGTFLLLSYIIFKVFKLTFKIIFTKMKSQKGDATRTTKDKFKMR